MPHISPQHPILRNKAISPLPCLVPRSTLSPPWYEHPSEQRGLWQNVPPVQFDGADELGQRPRLLGGVARRQLQDLAVVEVCERVVRADHQGLFEVVARHLEHVVVEGADAVVALQLGHHGLELGGRADQLARVELRLEFGGELRGERAVCCRRPLPGVGRGVQRLRRVGGGLVRWAIMACEAAEEEGRRPGLAARAAAALPRLLGMELGTR